MICTEDNQTKHAHQYEAVKQDNIGKSFRFTDIDKSAIWPISVNWITNNGKYLLYLIHRLKMSQLWILVNPIIDIDQSFWYNDISVNQIIFRYWKTNPFDSLTSVKLFFDNADQVSHSININITSKPGRPSDDLTLLWRYHIIFYISWLGGF